MATLPCAAPDGQSGVKDVKVARPAGRYQAIVEMTQEPDRQAPGLRSVHRDGPCAACQLSHAVFFHLSISIAKDESIAEFN